jgi:hypothetical protein
MLDVALIIRRTVHARARNTYYDTAVVSGIRIYILEYQ